VMNDVATKKHIEAAREFKKLYALLKENEVLIRTGTYQRGNDEELDQAIDKKEDMDNFLKQDSDERIGLDEIVGELMEIVKK